MESCLAIGWRTFLATIDYSKVPALITIDGSVGTVYSRVGNGISFRKNSAEYVDSEWVPLFRGIKCSFRGIPRVPEESIPRLGTEGNGMKKISFTKNSAPENRIDSIFSSETCFGKEFLELSSIFVPRNGIPSCFLFRGMIRNRIPIVCFYCCSTERNSELISLPRNGSERNSESLLLLMTVQNSEHFSPLRNGSERNSESFLFHGIAGIPPEQTKCSVLSVFRGIIFLSEIANPSLQYSRLEVLEKDMVEQRHGLSLRCM
jgi:hypothetical protein